MPEDRRTSTGPACACERSARDTRDTKPGKFSWNVRYAVIIAAMAALWWGAYSLALPSATWLTYKVFGIATGSHFGASLEFFLYDTTKIFLLLVAMIYVIGWIRASLNVERVRDYLAGRRRFLGYMLGSGFGSITPFCSCSSVPLFVGFTTAGIPIGITMSFLITSPLINEIAVILLWGLLGWKFTVAYVAVGIAAGIIGGFFMDAIKAGRWLQPFLLEAVERAPAGQAQAQGRTLLNMTARERHNFAYGETRSIFQRVWKWVFIGVGVGAALHGFVPGGWFENNLGAGQWWTVPVAVFVAIPLYSNVTGIIPVMQSLLVKGMPLGTTMAFCMSSVAASIPEVLMLRQIMQVKLQAAFIVYLWVIFTLVGWLFNWLGPCIKA